MPNIVHVVGTGTIGEPLIGLLCHLKNELGLDEITFCCFSATDLLLYETALGSGK